MGNFDGVALNVANCRSLQSHLFTLTIKTPCVNLYILFIKGRKTVFPQFEGFFGILRREKHDKKTIIGRVYTAFTFNAFCCTGR